MSRVSKADVNAVLQRTAQKIIDAGGSDGRTSRAEMTTALKGLTGKEKALTDVFFKFIDHRDFKAGAQVTPADVKRAVAYAKTTLVAKYDLDNNGLTKAEISKMSLTGKLAVSLAKELKAAALDGGTAGNAQLTKDIKAFYEAAVKKGQFPIDGSLFKGEKPVEASALPPAARTALEEYEAVAADGLRNGPGPYAAVATFKGQTVFIVSGDLSDTGSEKGFYSVSGELLAKSYSGQGANPNQAGVDWLV